MHHIYSELKSTVDPRDSGLQNSGLPLSSGQFLGDQLFVPSLYVLQNSGLPLSSGQFPGDQKVHYCEGRL